MRKCSNLGIYLFIGWVGPHVPEVEAGSGDRATGTIDPGWGTGCGVLTVGAPV